MAQSAIIDVFISRLVQEYPSLHKDNLYNLWTSLTKRCDYAIKKGTSSEHLCGNKIKENGRCSKHLSSKNKDGCVYQVHKRDGTVVQCGKNSRVNGLCGVHLRKNKRIPTYEETLDPITEVSESSSETSDDVLFDMVKETALVKDTEKKKIVKTKGKISKDKVPDEVIEKVSEDVIEKVLEDEVAKISENDVVKKVSEDVIEKVKKMKKTILKKEVPKKVKKTISEKEVSLEKETVPEKKIKKTIPKKTDQELKELYANLFSDDDDDVPKKCHHFVLNNNERIDCNKIATPSRRYCSTHAYIDQ